MRRLTLCLVLLLLILPAPAHSAPAPNKLGLHLLLDDGRGTWPVERWPAHLQYARQAVGEWGYVVQLVRGDDLNPARWQVFMNLCADLHLTPIIRLATTYDRVHRWWQAPRPDLDGTYRTLAAQYAGFIAALKWPTPKHYVLALNEPNHGDEWSGRPDPAQYARFLMDVADALHAADPGAQVLNAGLDPYAPHTGDRPFTPGGSYLMDEETFLDEMSAASPGVFKHLDAWASHAYPMGPFSEGPWRQQYGRELINGASNPAHRDPPPGINNRGVNGYEWELFKLSTYGIDNLPVLITETGWRKRETTDPRAADGGQSLPDAATAADYVDLALNGNGGRYPQYPETGWRPWRDDPRLVAVVFFALDGAPRDWGHTNWLKLDSSGAVQGTYPAFERLGAN